MIKIIDSFREENSYLSNFYPCEIEYEGIIYKSSEAAYQASKTFDKAARLYIAGCKSPKEAKKEGKKLQKTKLFRENFHDIKVGIMEEIVRIKFNTHKELADKLVATGDAILIEGNFHRDNFWGVYQGRGYNHLGKILMKIRAEICQSRKNSKNA